VSPGTWADRIRAQLAQVVDDGRWRAPRTFDALGPGGELEGADVVSFASNDYLGLSCHPAVVAEAHAALDRWGTGAGASRLVTGSRPVHADLEREVAAWKGTDAAVCFPSGFAANLGVLSVLGGPGVSVFSDELNHASIIDGCRLSRSDVSVYRHLDLAHLEQMLASAARRAQAPALVVTDSVFSMDGDSAPLDELFELCLRHGALLVIDEAHAVLGPHLDVSALSEDGRATVVRVGTLSKTLGALGGFVAASRDVVDLLINRARPYIFSTALSPADAAAALAALEVLRSAEGDALTARLSTFVGQLAGAGLAPPDHPSPIVPVVLGSERAALDASAALLEAGLWVPAIRPPTVPAGTSRLRVTLSAAHDAAILGAASGEEPETVCPPHRWYEMAMAPPMAADALGRPSFTLDELVEELQWPEVAVAVGFLETAGGLRSPLADDGDCLTLVVATMPDVIVLVADAGLGTINSVRLTMNELNRLPADVVIVLNRFDAGSELHQRNLSWLRERDGLRTFVTPGGVAELADFIAAVG
jgi:8-amino-7-oxononanoate synthase